MGNSRFGGQHITGGGKKPAPAGQGGVFSRLNDAQAWVLLVQAVVVRLIGAFV